MKPSTPLRALSNLSSTLPQRRWPPLLEPLTPTSAHRLSQSLTSFLPAAWIPRVPALSTGRAQLPPGYHLVYFAPLLGPSELLADGTDARHSPGPPFVRRMWAGGCVRFPAARRASGAAPAPALVLNGGVGVCVERIRDVSVKGAAGAEKVFVGIERRMGALAVGKEGEPLETEEEIVERLWREDESEFGDALVVERRNIVFMRERTKEEMEEAMKMVDKPRNSKVKKPSPTPTITHTLTPTAALLFRYSALTMNAHAIHLDRSYCRATEGHRNLLVHGPLTCTLLMTMLQAQLAAASGPASIASFDYRNVAPLYADEPLTLAAAPSEAPAGAASGEWRLWAENALGEVAVRATARVVHGD